MATPAPPRLSPGERIRRMGIAAWSIIGLLILAAIVGWLLYKVRVIFPPLVLALLVIYLLKPIVDWLVSRRIPRAAAAVVTYVVVVGTIVLLSIGIAPFLSRQAGEFADQWPTFRNKIVTFADDTSNSIDRRFGIRINTDQFSCLLGVDRTVAPSGPSAARCDEIVTRFRNQFVSSASRFTRIGFSVLEILLVFFIAPLMALYLLIDLPQLRRDFYNLIPEGARPELVDLGSKASATLGGFFRGQLLIALVVGGLSAFGFWAIGLPFWLIIGAIAGFFNLVPLIGPIIGGGIGFLVGTVSGGIWVGLLAAAVELVVQQLDTHLISPRILRSSAQLHPVTVLLSLLAGGALAGVWGVLAAVPTVAIAKLLLGHFWSTRVLAAETTPAVAPVLGVALTPRGDGREEQRHDEIESSP